MSQKGYLRLRSRSGNIQELLKKKKNQTTAQQSVFPDHRQEKTAITDHAVFISDIQVPLTGIRLHGQCLAQ